jgi:hypothetical protein|uniref:Glycosyl transferase family 11 n=1 Tax=viral metagenome TaxID=1070528 RepID=A0A6C0CBU4_9ZZZZ
MIYIEIMGGLGNQLFQIFCGIAYSFENRIPFKISASKFDLVSPHDSNSKRPTYWGNFLSNLSVFTYQQQLTIPTYREESFKYKTIPHISEDFKLCGYYQSYKYFDTYFNQICRLINLEHKRTTVKDKYKYYFNNTKTISMHFRIGDSIKNPDFHIIMKVEYFSNALKFIINQEKHIKNFDILYFSEEIDKNTVKIMIAKLKLEFSQCNFIQCSFDVPDWEQLLLMSVCHHNIIANSTFSWWGAYFNNNIDKIVCYPSQWFGKKYNIDTSELCPENWNKISII